MMFATLKAIHLLALAFGATASLGNIFVLLAKGPHDLFDPAFANSLRKWFRLTALVAIAVLWASGLVLAVAGYGWPRGMAFNIKLLAVILLTLSVLFVNFMAAGWARRGGPPSWLPVLHGVNAALLLSATVLAAYAFT